MKIGLITDIHEQTTSLERVLALADKLGCDDMACLGDIAGYDSDLYLADGKRSASECVRLVRENCRWVVGGNHDRDPLEPTQDLTEEDLDYLHRLPEFLIIKPYDRPILLSHYLYPDFTGSSMAFVRRLNQLDPLYAYLTDHQIHLAFAGHDHPAGVGFGYPVAPGWISRMRRAFHYLPFHRYELDGQRMVCLLPAVATRSGRPGLTIWDPVIRTLDVIQSGH
jgi:predicted phosphodiesterase